MKLKGQAAGYASEMIRRGTSQVIPEPELRWFMDKKLVDVNGGLECELYWQAIRDGILNVEYVIGVVGGKPALVPYASAVSTGLVLMSSAFKAMEQAIAIGLCHGGPLKLERNHTAYQVVAR